MFWWIVLFSSIVFSVMSLIGWTLVPNISREEGYKIGVRVAAVIMIGTPIYIVCAYWLIGKGVPLQQIISQALIIAVLSWLTWWLLVPIISKNYTRREGLRIGMNAATLILIIYPVALIIYSLF